MHRGTGVCSDATDSLTGSDAMLMNLIVLPFMLAAADGTQAKEIEFEDIEAIGGRARMFMEAPATPGTSMYCEYEIRSVQADGRWVPLLAINIDEGELTDSDSRFLQLDMQFLADKKQTIMHAISNHGFDENGETPFLYHWQQSDWYSMYLTWEGDGVFRYIANVGGTVVGTGEITETDFEPKYFRVMVSGLKASLHCNVE
ncbi:MAG: hypothetical protein AAGA44_10100 [Pseudomonadota bacterium]